MHPSTGLAENTIYSTQESHVATDDGSSFRSPNAAGMVGQSGSFGLAGTPCRYERG